MVTPQLYFEPRRVNLDWLYPEFRDDSFAIVDECIKLHDAHYVALEGYRDWARSDQLAAAGEVQAAPGGWSAHNYGLGLDLGRHKLPRPPPVEKDGIDWDEEAYYPLMEVAQRHGCDSGGLWSEGRKDWDHINLLGFSNKRQLAPLRAIIRRDREPVEEWLLRVWEEVDRIRKETSLGTA